LDFFSAIFDNQDSDEEDVIEVEPEKKNGDVPKPIYTQSSIAISSRPSMMQQQQSRDSDNSDSSDSSIEEIENPSKMQLIPFLISIIFLCNNR
jgi:hypothetical protein